MTRSFWRIATDTKDYEADDMCGTGAPDMLGVGWDAQPAGRVSIAFGTRWANSGRSALLTVPSVIVPEESNLLVNPLHPDADKLKARKIRKWLYDPRMTVRK